MVCAYVKAPARFIESPLRAFAFERELLGPAVVMQNSRVPPASPGFRFTYAAVYPRRPKTDDAWSKARPAITNPVVLAGECFLRPNKTPYHRDYRI